VNKFRALVGLFALSVGFIFSRPAPLQAVGAFVPDFVYQACVSSITISSIQISTTALGGQLGVGSGPAEWTVQVDTPILPGRILMTIQNNDPVNSLWCNTNAALLKAGGGIGNGYQIFPSTGTAFSGGGAGSNVLTLPLASSAYTGPTFNGPATVMHLYCVTDRATNASTATVVQCY
jgi:hypothetical protein